MSETNNVTSLPSPKYRLRPATIDDAAVLSGILSAGVADDRFTELFVKQDYQAAIAILFANAFSVPQNREEMMHLLAGMWEHDVDVAEPPEDWDYDPDPDLVARGQATERGQRWRSIARKNRRRIAKRIEIGKLPASEIKGFVSALRESNDLKDFLDSLNLPATDSSGAPSTESSGATGGGTGG